MDFLKHYLFNLFAIFWLIVIISVIYLVVVSIVNWLKQNLHFLKILGIFLLLVLIFTIGIRNVS